MLRSPTSVESNTSSLYYIDFGVSHISIQVRKAKLDIFKGSLGYRQEYLLGAIIIVHSRAWTKTMEATMGVWGRAERVARGRVYRKEGTWAVGFRNQLG